MTVSDIPLPNCTVAEYVKNEYTQNDNLDKDVFLEKVFYSSQFNINNVLNRKIDELSTGEIQLVKLYSAILKKEADCYLLDEPLANIYPELQSATLNLLREIAKTKLVIIISHDLQFAKADKNIRIG